MRIASDMAILRQSLRLLLLLLRKLFLGLLNHFLELSHSGNGGRTESVFGDIAPNRSIIEGVLNLSAIRGERVLRWSNFGLGMRAGRRRFCRDWRGRPMLCPDAYTGVNRFHDDGTIIRNTAYRVAYCLTIATPDRDDQIRIRCIQGR